MKILITADLHYDIARSRKPAEQLAEEVCRTPADALVLVGDSAGADLQPLRDCLGLFAGFAGRKFMVPGNHCLWGRGGHCSMQRYLRIVPEVAAEIGFAVLDHAPAVLEEGGVAWASGPSVERASCPHSGAAGETAGETPTPQPMRVGLVGSIGWYDYTFRFESLGIPEDFYAAKVAPGAAAYLSEHRHLVEMHRDALTPAHLEMGSRWMDGVHVKLGMSDPEFVEFLALRLAGQLDDLAPKVDRIVAFTHHLPFRAMIPQGWPGRFAFAAAYMGSQRLGDVLLANPKVTHVYCGHSHRSDELRMGRISVTNVGSTYVEKKLVTLAL